jgi:hypothetical protein
MTFGTPSKCLASDARRALEYSGMEDKIDTYREVEITITISQPKIIPLKAIKKKKLSATIKW